MMPLVVSLFPWCHQHSLLIISFLLPLFFFFLLPFFLGQNKVMQSERRKLTSLPTPPRLPVLGNLHQLGSAAHRSLRSLSEKYGPVMLMYFGCVPTVIVSSAEAAHEVMKTRDLAFASRPKSSMADRLLYNSHDVAFSPYSEYWRQVRRICVLHLLSLKRVQSFRSVREEEVVLMIDNIRCAASNMQPVNPSKLISTLTSDIVCRVAFGRKYSKEEDGGNTFREMLRETLELLGTFPVGDFIPRLRWVDWLRGLDARVRNTAKQIDCFTEKIIEAHLHVKNDGSDDHRDICDFIDVLLSLDNDKNDGSGISLGRDSIKAVTLDMFAGGTDTTYTVIEWVMAELVRHPKDMKRVQEEVRKVVGLKEKIEEELLGEMHYLKAVIKEVLRLDTPVPLLVPRESIEDTKLQGYDIPAGTRVMINAWAIARDPRSWERAEEFWPDRFMNSSFDFRGQDFQFIPFGAGRRGCPGIAFSIPVVELALANLLHHFDWELPDGMKEESLDMSESAGITSRKKVNLILVAKPRII
ncbi:cytochrome P450 71A1-like [Phoenix dactylifera]|uniref:Cytochrome P450 71A1-like n=1 Tax=Phoenix dactylifera TaxID=42345 RepID=A0A8B7CHC2_PHODC|nr:cytochrome P450 71A1-like [Phoenix dactylifera]